jgi:hypothetical protein
MVICVRFTLYRINIHIWNFKITVAYPYVHINLNPIKEMEAPDWIWGTKVMKEGYAKHDGVGTVPTKPKPGIQPPSQHPK